MKLEDLIYDIKHILLDFGLSTVIIDGDIIDKLAFYRMAYIVDYYDKKAEVLQEWFQSVGILTVEDWLFYVVDEVDITGGIIKNAPKTIKLGKGNHLHLYDQYYGKQLYPESFEKISKMIELNDSRVTRFNFFCEHNNAFLTYPKKNIKGSVIFQEPTDATIETGTEEVKNGELLAGEQYLVVSGSITYSTLLGQETTFGTGDIFTGTGLISWVNNQQTPAVIQRVGYRKFGYADEYPLDVRGAQFVILEILTKDYAIQKKSIADIVQDNQDQFKILASK